jgi:uncharacterized protein (DUF1697 family)
MTVTKRPPTHMGVVPRRLHSPCSQLFTHSRSDSELFSMPLDFSLTSLVFIRKAISQAQLRAELLPRLPFEAEVMICNGQDLMSLASGDPFAAEPPRPDVVRFVSVLAKRPCVLPSIPISLPPDGKWLLRILATQGRFLFGLYRRQMKAISFLSAIDKIFGVPATTRNWNTIATIVNVLKSKES